MNCEKCGKGMKDGVTLYRQNPKGETGVWRCSACNRTPVDPETAELIVVIEGKK